jgi:hypothetical protein
LPEHREDGRDGRDEQDGPAAQPQEAAEKPAVTRGEVGQYCLGDSFLLYGQRPDSPACVRHRAHGIMAA